MANSRLCAITSCGKPVLARGYCNHHYKRFKRHGDPLGGQPRFREASPETCRVEACGKPPYSRGYCSRHYERLRRHGDPTGGGIDRGSLLAWIKAHVEFAAEECLTWPFSRSTDQHGYGRLTVHRKSAKAHRLMCTLAHGEPPSPTHDAAHSCGNGHLGCVNPGHLRWATRAENIADMRGHGTALIGERAPWSKLTEDNVRFIRAQRGKMLQRELAELFGVTKSTIQHIQSRKRWQHVT